MLHDKNGTSQLSWSSDSLWVNQIRSKAQYVMQVNKYFEETVASEFRNTIQELLGD